MNTKIYIFLVKKTDFELKISMLGSDWGYGSHSKFLIQRLSDFSSLNMIIDCSNWDYTL